jgi:pyruvate dehydrogenase E2 component (dihydrolipoamide acetyltransferase)
MDILMPQLGETVTEGTVTSWYKQVGDAIAADEPLFDVETDKVSTEIPCPTAGIVAEILVPAGTTVKVGTRLAVVRGAREAAAAPTGATAMAAPATAPSTSVPAPRAIARISGQKLSPVVRRLLAEHGLAPADVHGTGRDGRVTRDDVLAHVQARGRDAAPPPVVAQPATASAPVPPVRPAAEPAPVAAPDSLATGESYVPFNTIRRKTAHAMARAWSAVPHVLQAIEVDYSRIESVRRARAQAWKAREGYSLTFLPFVALAVCQALARYGRLNARIEGDGLVVSRRVHLGIAVDLDHDGLLVPVVKDAQDRTLPALAREMQRLAVGARAGRLKPDDFGQPSYTLSNSGVYGTLITAPIVNPPQVAILSTDGVKKRPFVIESAEGDSIAIRPVGVLAQSFDHRAVDGAYSAAFLREVKRILETRAWDDDVAAH